jgi:hypothetical protein
MNTNRKDFNLPLNHIRITPYWLLGFIEGDGSFFIRRTSLTPSFSLSVTAVQKPVLEKIQTFLQNQLDEYSYIKAVNTKLINLSFEPGKGNSKGMIKLQINQID